MRAPTVSVGAIDGWKREGKSDHSLGLSSVYSISSADPHLTTQSKNSNPKFDGASNNHSKSLQISIIIQKGHVVVVAYFTRPGSAGQDRIYSHMNWFHTMLVISSL